MASITDFNAYYATNPGFKNAWDEVNTHFAAEGKAGAATISSVVAVGKNVAGQAVDAVGNIVSVGVNTAGQAVDAAGSIIAIGRDISGHPIDSAGRIISGLAQVSPDVSVAMSAFVNSFDDLSSKSFGVSGQDIITATKSFVLSGHTLSGAINTVTGLAASSKLLPAGVGGIVSSAGALIGAVESEDPIAITTAFTGTLVAAAAAAGAVSMGVGAAIVAGVGALMAIMKGAGVFGKPPPGEAICDDIGYRASGKPDWVIGCIAVSSNISDGPNKYTGGRIAPNSASWIRFPQPPDSVSKAVIDKNRTSDGKNFLLPPSGSSAAKDLMDAVWRNNWYSPIKDVGSVWSQFSGYTVLENTIGNNGVYIDWSTTSATGLVQFSVIASNANAKDSASMIDVAFPNYKQVRKTALKLHVEQQPGRVISATDNQIGVDFIKAFTSAWAANAEYALNGMTPTTDEDMFIHFLKMWNTCHLGPALTIFPSDDSYPNVLARSIVQNVLPVDDPLIQGGGLKVNYGSMKPALIPIVTVKRPLIAATRGTRITQLVTANASTIYKAAVKTGDSATLKSLYAISASPFVTTQAKASIPKPIHPIAVNAFNSVKKKSNAGVMATVGAAGGFAVGGPIGAGIGGVVGYVLGK